MELVECNMRGIWLRRNLLLFEKKFESPSKVIGATNRVGKSL